MSENKKPKEIRVKNLVIHADNVEVIDRKRDHDRDKKGNPWDFFWGRPLGSPEVDSVDSDEQEESSD